MSNQDNFTKSTRKTIKDQKSVGTSIKSQLASLDTQVDWFYSDEFNLDDALKNYENALKLAKDIEQNLKTLKNHIEILTF